MSKPRYVHHGSIHNLTAPSIIVKDLVAEYGPRSVIDVGCGLGTFLAAFESNGVTDIWGVDGAWVDRARLFIDPKYFQEFDLQDPYDPGRIFDMAICVEVAEHLAPETADTLVDTLCRSSRTIVFSAAIPGQGGEGHLNEQPYEYWQEKFRQHGFHFYDVFRERYWQVEEIEWWYRQNLFLVAHEDMDLAAHIRSRQIDGPAPIFIHPQLQAYLLTERDRVRELLNDLSSPAGILRLITRFARNRLPQPSKPLSSNGVKEIER